MSLTIKNKKTERLARLVAKTTGEALTRAVEVALRQRLERLRRRHRQNVLAEKLGDILRRVDRLPALDTRPETEILGYDDQELPG